MSLVDQQTAEQPFRAAGLYSLPSKRRSENPHVCSYISWKISGIFCDIAGTFLVGLKKGNLFLTANCRKPWASFCIAAQKSLSGLLTWAYFLCPLLSAGLQTILSCFVWMLTAAITVVSLLFYCTPCNAPGLSLLEHLIFKLYYYHNFTVWHYPYSYICTRVMHTVLCLWQARVDGVFQQGMYPL